MIQRSLTLALMALCLSGTLACSKSTTKKEVPREDAPRVGSLGLLEPGFKTAQRQLVDAAIARSRASGKPLLLRMTGAWCSPCFALNEALAAGKERLVPTLQRYEVLILDEVFFERSALNDFLPTEGVYFPIYFFYHPKNERWTSYSTGGQVEDTVGLLQETLATFADEGSLTQLYAKRYAEGKTIQIEFDTSIGKRTYYAAVSRALDLALTGTVAEVDAFLAELEADIAAMSAAGTPSTTIDIWSVTGYVTPLLVATGKLTAEDARQRLSQAAAKANATPGSQYRAVYDAALRSEVHRVSLEKGLAAGAARCEEIARDGFAGQPGDSPQKASIRGIVCAVLGLHAGSLDKETALARATAIENDPALLASEAPYAALVRLHLAAGDLEGAAVWAGKANDDWSKSFDKYFGELPSRQAKVNDALATEAAGENRPHVIAALQARRAHDDANTALIPSHKAHTNEAYAELQARLRSGDTQPGLAHKRAGAETP